MLLVAFIKDDIYIKQQIIERNHQNVVKKFRNITVKKHNIRRREEKKKVNGNKNSNKNKFPVKLTNLKS